MSFGNAFVDGISKSYIIQCDLGLKVYVFTKIQ
jgi:hypothetical protein